MRKRLYYFILAGCLAFAGNRSLAQNASSFGNYHSPQEVQQMLKKISGNGATKLHQVAVSPGGEPITVLEIGTGLEDVPAVFVGANFEGNVPLSTEGALYLAQMLLDSSAYTQNLKWYIMPLPNPDAAKDFFSSLKTGSSANFYAMNNDADIETDEDGPEDLNGDGLITQMRVKDLEGRYVISKNDPRIMERADAKKNERGEYKLYSEGIDNDGDGQYNEDGKGGINVGIAFPHLFPFGNMEAGRYPTETPEVYGILRFITDRPNIAMVYTIGTSNFCLVPPKTGRKGGVNLDKIELTGRNARMLNADPTKTYTMDEVIEMMKQRMPGMEITPSMVAGRLGLGAAVNPQDEDLVFYKNFSDQYKEYLKVRNFSTETLDPTPAKDGSFELWAYYHLGVPSFSMNLFSVPKVKEEKAEKEALSLDDAEKMSNQDFIALGEEKITAFLKANNAPDRLTAEGLIKRMQDGEFTPKQMVAMLKRAPKTEKEGELSDKDKALLAWSEKEWEGKGFVQWTKVDHPTLGEVEVGGYAPYLETTPKPTMIDSLAKTQLPWLLQLSKKLPQPSIESQKVEKMGDGIFKLELFVTNNGALPYPTSMGERNEEPAPIILVLTGDFELLEGKSRTPVGSLGVNQVKKFSWIVKASKAKNLTATLESAVFTDVVKQINIGG